MGARTGRVIGITAASLIWLAGCETTSSLNPFKFASTDATNSQAKSETEPETTGTVPPPVGDPPARPELLGSDPNDDVSLAKSYFRQGSYGLAERHFRKAVECIRNNSRPGLGSLRPTIGCAASISPTAPTRRPFGSAVRRRKF